ncbi:MAG: hypothetical protein AB7V48_16715 [Sedimentibacter sp.]
METFYENYFKPQDVVPDSRLFSPEHIILSSLAVMVIHYIYKIQMERCDGNFSIKILKKSSILMIFLEIFRIGWLTFYNGFNLKNIRFDWCNQISLVLPFIVLSGKKKLYPYIDILSFMGGAGVILYPIWVFYDYAGIHIMSVQSMVSHTLMVILAITMSFVSDHWEHEQDIKKPFTGFAVIAVVAFVMSRVLNTNYLIMLNANGIPLLRHFSFPWYWIVALPLLAIFINMVRLSFTEIRNRINNKKSDTPEYLETDDGVESLI